MSRWSPKTRWLGLGITLAGTVAAVVVIVLVSFGSPAPRSYYLALGDSLSVGIQPTARGASVKTDAGYTNDLYRHFVRRIPGLTLVQMGCPGDSSATVATGQGNAMAAKAYHCDRRGGSQLTAALAFIRAHRSEVKLVTIDIGANDLNYCIGGASLARGAGYLASCVEAAERGLLGYLPRILGPISAAVAPGTPLAAGQIYDPLLAGYGSQNQTLSLLAKNSVAVVNQMNAEITAAATQAGFGTADVAGTFRNDDGTMVRSGNRTLPRDLVVLCAYTYICTPAPQGPNIHPNSAGYRAIAKAYEAVLPPGL